MGTDHDLMTAGEDDHPPAVTTARASWRRWWWLPAVVAIQKLLFWGVAANLDRSRWFNNLFNWDAWFYLDIAENGYRTATFIDGRLVRTNMAFVPLYPMLGRALSWRVVRPFAAVGYRLVARYRYKLPGATDACRI